MRTTLGELKKMILEVAGEQLELPFPRDEGFGPEVDELIARAADLTAQIESRPGREEENRLRDERSQLLPPLKRVYTDILEQLRMARQVGDQGAVDEVLGAMNDFLHRVNVEGFGYRTASSEIFWDVRDVYGGDPKNNPGGLGT